MRRLGIFLFGIVLSVGVSVCVQSDVRLASAETTEVYIGGMPAGFTLSAGGAQVLGFSDVLTENGVRSPAAESGMRAGDLIIGAEGISLKTITELNEIIEKNGNKTLHLDVIRGETELKIELLPAKDKATGRYKIGVLIRDGVSGIGTVTYIDAKNGRFGALGHAVLGTDSRMLSLTDGQMYSCNIVGVSKGIKGKAGELRGMILAEKSLGKAEKLCTCGIYGKISGSFETKGLRAAKASAESAKPGKASIYSTVSGEIPHEYSIEIVKVDKMQRDNKNFVVKITDSALIEETGGIVQGMSGSPIIQDGKLIGAITHVFVNDPTRGYGISIDKMLQQ